jgi:hypothetical protein
VKLKIKSFVEQYLRDYPIKEIKITNKCYDLRIFSKYEEKGSFDSFLLVEVNKDELNTLLEINDSSPRIGFFLHNDQLIIKDYLRNFITRKALQKIDARYLSKIKRAITKPNINNFYKLFDRNDAIEDFYIIYKNSRDFLRRNLKCVEGEIQQSEIIDKFMMQMLTFWYLQEKGFFNKDSSYFITKFKEIQAKKANPEFKYYHEFLYYFFEKISIPSDHQNKVVKLGDIAVIGLTIPILDNKEFRVVRLPDECFFQENLTEKIIKTLPKRVTFDIPLLNLLESRDWTEGNFDEFILGAIFEKLMTEDPNKRKKTGSYYTPEEITTYICKKTIEDYLVDRINRKNGEYFSSLDSILASRSIELVNSLLDEVKVLKILDPAVGSGHFLDSAISVLIAIYQEIRLIYKELKLKKSLNVLIKGKNSESKSINLLEVKDNEEFEYLLKFSTIFPNNIYGVDINPHAIKIAQNRLVMSLAKHYNCNSHVNVLFPLTYLNLKTGNALISNYELKKESIDEKVDYKVFNWLSEFPAVFKNGSGFNIVIGNPPYVNPSDVDYWHLLKGSKNLYDAFIRLSIDLLAEDGRLGFIHPNSAYCQPKFRKLREFLHENVEDLTVINFAIRPQPVFKGVMQRIAITICSKNKINCTKVKTSRYLRLNKSNRYALLGNPPVFDSSDVAWNFDNFIPKIGNELDHRIFKKVFSNRLTIREVIDKNSGIKLYYHDSGESYWTKLVTDEPKGIRNGKKVRASHWNKIQVIEDYSQFIICYINSTLFYWLWLTISDCRDLTLETLMQAPVPDIQLITTDVAVDLEFHAVELMKCYANSSKYVEKRKGYFSLEFKVNKCKALVNAIDRIVGEIFGLNQDEINYLIDYDKDMRTG